MPCCRIKGHGCSADWCSYTFSSLPISTHLYITPQRRYIMDIDTTTIVKHALVYRVSTRTVFFFITKSRILIQTRSCIQYTTGNEPHDNSFLLLTLSSCNVSPTGIYSITIFRHVWDLKLSWQVYDYIHTLELEVGPEHHCTFLCARGNHWLTNEDCLYMDDKDNE